MKLYLDTSQPKTVMRLDDKTYEWESGHDLAKHLHQFIHERPRRNNFYVWTR